MLLFAGNKYLLLCIPGAIVIGLVVWGVLNPASDFRIVVNRKGVHFRGKLPPGFRPDVTQLLRDEMQIEKAVIWGNWSDKRILRLKFRGRLDQGQQQRIRNYLATTLRS